MVLRPRLAYAGHTEEHAMAQMTVAVTGASGFVGRRVVAELRSRGHDVRALVRDLARGGDALGRDEAITLVEGDILDADALDRLVEGADAAVHLVGIIREAPGGQTFDRMHVGATESILAACARAGVCRYAHMSALGVGAEGVCEYQRSKHEAETRVRDSDLDWTIFRPGLIHGAGSGFVEMVVGWVRAEEFPRSFIPYFSRSVEDTSVFLGPVHQEPPVVAPVAVEDVAWCFAEALERDRTIGEVYNLAGPDPMPFPQMLLRFRDAIPGAKTTLHPRGIPASIAARGARLARTLRLDALLPFDEGMARMGAQDSVAEHEKAEAHLGWTPSHFGDRLEAYAPSL
jgi:NADH dehydrogenase